MDQNLAGLLPLVLIVLFFWLLIIRPQRRRQREMAQTQASVSPGTEVMLGSGIFGTVASVEDETIRVEVAPGTQLKVARQAVVRIIEPVAADPAVADHPDDADPRHP